MQDAPERRVDGSACKGELKKPKARQQRIAFLRGDADGQERLDGLAAFEQAHAAVLVDFVVVELLHISGGEPLAIVMDARGECSRLLGRVGL